MSQDVELWERELRQAGWNNTMPTVWQSPSGHYFRGPYKAWTLLHSHPELSIKHKSWQDVTAPDSQPAKEQP